MSPLEPRPEEVLSQFLWEVQQLGQSFAIEADGGTTPDDSQYLQLGYTRADAYGVVLVLAPKASPSGPLTIAVGRFEGTGRQRAQAVGRWLEDW